MPAKFPSKRRQSIARCIAEVRKWRCAYCYADLDPETTTVDHVIPKCKGGVNAPHNLLAACEPCNFYRGTLNAFQFFKVRQRGVAQGWWLPGCEPEYGSEREMQIGGIRHRLRRGCDVIEKDVALILDQKFSNPIELIIA